MKKDETLEVLESLGLTKDQATVYQTLIKHGFMKAGSIPKYAKIKRGLVYKVLEQLIEIGLVEKHGEESSVARYSPLSPEKLRIFVEEKKEQARQQEERFYSIYGNLKSQFNLLSGKPSVQYFEGIDGVEKMLEDSLHTDGIIYTYGDAESVQKYFPKINEKHITDRQKYKVKKAILIIDNKLGKKFEKAAKKDPITDVKLIKNNPVPIGSLIEIYDNKVSFITISKLGQSGVLIEDKQIANMHRYIFETLFGKTKFKTKEKNT